MVRDRADEAPARRRRALRAASALILMSALAAPAAVQAPAAAEQLTTHRCMGFAPTVTSCTTGQHTRSGDLVHNVAAEFNYLGTVESSLTWGGGQHRIFRCTFLPLFPRTCLAHGTFPPEGASFTHTCRSLVPGSAFSAGPGIEFDGVEGGVGTWQCSLSV